MNACPTCGATLDEAGFADCLAINCQHDRRRFQIEVEDTRASLTPLIVQAMAENKMPACFEATRSTTVALASLLMQALRQNEEMAQALGARQTH